MAPQEKQVLEKILRLLTNQLNNGETVKLTPKQPATTGISDKHLKVLRQIARAPEPLKAEEFAQIARKAGYPKGQGAAAMFRGRHASLTYRVEKYIELTKRGKELVEAKEPITMKSEVLEESQPSEVKEEANAS